MITALVIAAWKFGGSSGTATIPNLGPPPATSTAATTTASPGEGGRRPPGRARQLRAPGARRRPRKGRLLFVGTLEQGRKQRFVARSVWILAASPENLAADRQRQDQAAARQGSARATSPSRNPATSSRRRLEPPARRLRGHGQRARARRANRPERAVPGRAGARARLRAVADRDRRRPRGGARARARARGSRPTSASPRAGSGRPTTTARSSSSPARPGASSSLDEALRATRSRRSRGRSPSGCGGPYADFETGVRKQATLPGGRDLARARRHRARASCSRPAARVAVVLPGPPGELQRLWPRALETEPVRALLARARPPGRRVLRFFGASESAVARALAEAGGEREGRGGDDLRARLRDPRRPRRRRGRRGSAPTSSRRRCASRSTRYLFAEDERPVEELVLALCRARGLTLATAESCTGGLVAARLTSVPGASDVFLGGVVAYADTVKEAELGVPADVLAAHGAVSAETAAAMAAGARARLGADVAVAVTGVAGPGRRHRGEAGRARLPPRVRGRRASGGASSTSRATGSRSGGAPPSPRSTSCGVF